MIGILKYFTFILTLMLHAYSLPNWRASETLLVVVQWKTRYVYTYYKYSTLPGGISINIAPKAGIFPKPKAEVNIHYQGCNIIDIPQGRVE